MGTELPGPLPLKAPSSCSTLWQVSELCAVGWEGTTAAFLLAFQRVSERRGARKLWFLSVSPLLPDGSSQNRCWAPLTLTASASGAWCQETQGWGPRCAPPRNRRPGSPGGIGVDSWGDHALVLPGSLPLREVQLGLEYHLQLHPIPGASWGGGYVCGCSHSTPWVPGVY